MSAKVQSLDWSVPKKPDDDTEKLSDEERGRRMVEAAKLVAGLPSEGYRRDRDIDNIRLYESDPQVTLRDFAGRHYADAGSVPLTPIDDSVDNKAKQAIGTLLAQICSTDQRARFKVVDGSYRQRRRGREMQNFSDGLVHEIKLHALKKRAGEDAAVLESGVGAIQFYRSGDRCAAQRILATELAIDPRDGLVDGEWRTIYRHRPISRAKVKAEFGGDVLVDAAIEDANAIDSTGLPLDEILVYEAWTLPSSPGAGDGWHVISLDSQLPGRTLLAEEYTKAHHEIVFLKWENKFTTGWGRSWMTQVRKLQRRINANGYRIDKAQRLWHAGHLYVDRAAKMKKSEMSNEQGSIWEGNGPNGPTQLLFNAVTAEMYQQQERDGQRIFEQLGANQGASTGETSRGLDASAAAMREETKKVDKRNSLYQQSWEQYGLDCVRVALSIVRDIVTHTEDGKERKAASAYKVAMPGKRGLTVVDWKEAAIDEADYVLETMPASPIPTDPAGLVAFGREMVDLGAWSPARFAGFMQDLDADGRVNRNMAQERRFEKMFEALLYDKTAAAMPDEFTNLQLALEIGADYLAQGEEDEVPDKHLERVRRYLKRCKKMDAAAKAAAQAAAQPPAPPAAAPAAVEAPVPMAA